MKALGSGIAAIALLFSGPALAAPAGPTVSVTGGAIAGKDDGKGGAIFLGIPFAAPPVGALRWRAPAPVEAWQGVRQATALPPACPQEDLKWNSADAARSNEDCLYLDVHTPRLDPGAKMPVLVWIHGGANWAGSAGETVMTDLVDKGIVVVAIQYRLGVLGFLSHPALSQEQGGASGNYGLMDQVRALQWVHDNIARFGGDPDQVTISGQSAGSQDVGLMMVAPDARGLFARAWGTGGPPGFGQKTRTLAENEVIGEQLAPALGTADTLEALRAAPVARLLASGRRLHSDALTGDDYIWIQAIVDGRVIREAPGLSFAVGREAPVPYVLSTNRIELPVPGGDTQTGKHLATVFGSQELAARTYYGLEGQPAFGTFDASYGTVGDRIGTDTNFRCPADNVARMHAGNGQMSWRAQFSVATNGRPAVHSSELAYLFSDKPLDPARPALTLQDYFANFIRTGDPNGPGLPAWKRFAPGEEAFVDFTNAGIKTGTRLGGAICRLVNGV